MFIKYFASFFFEYKNVSKFKADEEIAKMLHVHDSLVYYASQVLPWGDSLPQISSLMHFNDGDDDDIYFVGCTSA